MSDKVTIKKSIIERKIVQDNVKGSSQYGLKEGWTRGTFILRNEYLDKIKALSFLEARDIKLIMDEILENYLKDKKVEPVKKGGCIN